MEISQTIPYKGIRKMIGKRMEVSGAYPMTYQGMYVDVTDLLAFRKKVNAETGAGLTVNDFIVKAVSIALQRTPLMNSAFNEDMTQIQVYGNYNISVMTASDKGLVAPVIKETEKKTIYQISAEMKEMIEKAKKNGVTLLLPTDTVAADSFSNDAKRMVVSTMNIPDDYEGMDIGPDTTKTFCDAVRGAGTVVWNGPMGVFEFENFAAGTRAMAQALADSGAVTIVGGGDSAAAVEQMGFADKITHISTGGGASLEFLEGLELPGVACLLDK